jgi:hypothetical protein
MFWTFQTAATPDHSDTAAFARQAAQGHLLLFSCLCYKAASDCISLAAADYTLTSMTTLHMTIND